MKETYVRAKDLEGAWIEGCGVLEEGNKHFIACKRAGAKCYVEVLSNTINVSSGIFDDDNKMIFDRDVVDSEGDLFVIYKKITSQCFYWKQIKNNQYSNYGGLFPDDFDSHERLKIIGNLFDNPELLPDGFTI